MIQLDSIASQRCLSYIAHTGPNLSDMEDVYQMSMAIGGGGGGNTINRLTIVSQSDGIVTRRNHHRDMTAELAELLYAQCISCSRSYICSKTVRYVRYDKHDKDVTR